jgi:hypothetical protein
MNEERTIKPTYIHIHLPSEYNLKIPVQQYLKGFYFILFTSNSTI